MTTRRTLLTILSLAAVAPLAACNARGPVATLAQDDDAAWYTGMMPDKPYDVPLVDTNRLEPKYRRQVVSYKGPERPGTLVVDIDNRQLALVQEDGTALQYGGRRGQARLLLEGRGHGRPQGRVAGLEPDHHHGLAEPGSTAHPRRAASTTRSARARSTSTRTAATSCSASTAPTSPGASASSYRPAASACSTRTSSTSTSGSRSGTTVLVKRNGKYRV